MARGGVGARSLNIDLQAALNGEATPKIEKFGWTFAPGDKVMQIENDYDREVYNGDIGFIAAIDTEEAEITVRFDGRDVAYGLGDLDALVPAYAATIHKAQGSEYPAVVIPVLAQHYAMLQRNLLYTGITGASDWWCWSAAGRRRPSRCGTCRAAALVEAPGMACCLAGLNDQFGGKADGRQHDSYRPGCAKRGRRLLFHRMARFDPNQIFGYPARSLVLR